MRRVSGPPRRHPGEALQVDPIKRTLKPPGAKRLKLNYNEILSGFAFIFNMRRYTLEYQVHDGLQFSLPGRASHSFPDSALIMHQCTRTRLLHRYSRQLQGLSSICLKASLLKRHCHFFRLKVDNFNIFS